MKDRIEAALAAPACERLREFYAVGPVQRAAVESFADALGERALITRAVVLLLDWQVKYGTHQPQWLPPAGDVRWLEDATAYLNATAMPAPTPADPNNGLPEPTRMPPMPAVPPSRGATDKGAPILHAHDPAAALGTVHIDPRPPADTVELRAASGKVLGRVTGAQASDAERTQRHAESSNGARVCPPCVGDCMKPGQRCPEGSFPDWKPPAGVDSVDGRKS